MRQRRPPPAVTSELAIHLQAVRKQYEGHVAVRDLTLAVPRGSVYGLLGPTGAGRTSTIRMLRHITAPAAGSITVLGRPAGDAGLTDRIGYLPEERGLYRKMRVRDVLAFLARLKGVPGREVGRRIDAWLERFQLRGQGADWGTARVDELSRGMQQKVQFIGALLHEPELVILDEPFSGLDPVNAQALKDTVLDLRAQGRTIVFSTHVMENAERMCDAVCIIARGEKVLDGTVASVRDAHASRLVALTFETTPDAAVQAVLADSALVRSAPLPSRHLEVELQPTCEPSQFVARLLAAGAQLEKFEVVRPSLHRIFLERVGMHNVETGMRGHG
mgnify:CR=1 FL=1